jgi:ADP-ribose pyrophosphatase
MTRQIKKWQTVSSRLLVDHEQLRVIEDVVKLPNGRQSIYVRHASVSNHSVATIAVNDKKEILIQREYSYPPNKVMWQLPGGKMEDKETIEIAALRELAEESGYSAKKTTVLGSFFVHNRLSDRQQYVVLCSNIYEHSLPEDDDEFIESVWLPELTIKHMITEGEFDNINLLAGLNLWFWSKERIRLGFSI